MPMQPKSGSQKVAMVRNEQNMMGETGLWNKDCAQRRMENMGKGSSDRKSDVAGRHMKIKKKKRKKDETFEDNHPHKPERK